MESSKRQHRATIKEKEEKKWKGRNVEKNEKAK